MTVAEIARVIWEACGRDPDAFALEHLPTLRGRRRAPLAERREGRAAARLGGADRASREGVAQTVEWLRPLVACSVSGRHRARVAADAMARLPFRKRRSKLDTVKDLAQI